MSYLFDSKLQLQNGDVHIPTIDEVASNNRLDSETHDQYEVEGVTTEHHDDRKIPTMYLSLKIPESRLILNATRITSHLHIDTLLRRELLRQHPEMPPDELDIQLKTGELQVSKEVAKKIILHCIEHHPGIHTSELIAILGFDAWLTLQALDELQQEGLIE